MSEDQECPDPSLTQILRRWINGNFMGLISSLLGIIVVLYIRSIDDKFDLMKSMSVANERRIIEIEATMSARSLSDENRIATTEAQGKEISARLAALELQVGKLLDLQVQQLLNK